MKGSRTLRHLIAPHWLARRAFPRATLRAIEDAVAASEGLHAGELRFVVEAGLPFGDLWRDVSPRERARELFSRLRVWDTERNGGVLVYVQLVDRRVEIVADRGIAAKVPQSEWDAICRGMEQAFGSGDYRRGALEAIARLSRLLVLHQPSRPDDRNELSDRPLLL